MRMSTRFISVLNVSYLTLTFELFKVKFNILLKIFKKAKKVFTKRERYGKLRKRSREG